MAGGAAGVGRVRGSISRCSGLAWGEGRLGGATGGTYNHSQNV